MNVGALIPGNANSKPSSFRGGAKEKQMIQSLFYEVQTEDAIIPFLQELAPPSQNIPSIKPIIKEKPGEQLDLRHTTRLPQPRDSPGSRNRGEMILIISSGGKALPTPNISPAIFRIISGSVKVVD
jgi:hypothetical protein